MNIQRRDKGEEEKECPYENCVYCFPVIEQDDHCQICGRLYENENCVYCFPETEFWHPCHYCELHANGRPCAECHEWFLSRYADCKKCAKYTKKMNSKIPLCCFSCQEKIIEFVGLREDEPGWILDGFVKYARGD